MSEQSPTLKKSTVLWVAVFLIAVGFGTAALNWYTALTDNSYNITAALLMPFLGSLGLALLVAPEVEKPAEGPIRPPDYLRNLRRNLARAIVAVGLLASIADLVLISGWWF